MKKDRIVDALSLETDKRVDEKGDWSKMPSSSLHFGMHHMAREALFT
jgi:hypothetical protein